MLGTRVVHRKMESAVSRRTTVVLDLSLFDSLLLVSMRISEFLAVLGMAQPDCVRISGGRIFRRSVANDDRADA